MGGFIAQRLDEFGRGLAVCVAGLAVMRAGAAVDLELRPALQTVSIGDVVGVGLYAVSDDDGEQLLSAAQVILSWQPAHLQMLGNDDEGAVGLLSSGFPVPDPFNLNETDPPKDGNAIYVALAPIGAPVAATPEGTLLTTFEFEAVGPVASPGTPVDILEMAGDPTGETIVFDGTQPNLDVTGALLGAAVEIEPCCPADLDGDCVVGITDFLALLAAWGTDPGGPPDLDGSGDVGIGDFLELLAAWGPCPGAVLSRGGFPVLHSPAAQRGGSTS